MTHRIDLTVTDAARRQLDRLCRKLNIEPDPPRPRPRTLWQRVREWFFERPLRWPWLLGLETWVLERFKQRPRSCVLVVRELDRRGAAVAHEARDLTRRCDVALTDDARYLGFVPHSAPAGTPVEVRLSAHERTTAEVLDVGVDIVRVKDPMSGDVSDHYWWNVRRTRDDGANPDSPVSSPTWTGAGDMVPQLPSLNEDDLFAGYRNPKDDL